MRLAGALIFAVPLLTLGGCDFVLRLDHVGPDARVAPGDDADVVDVMVTSDGSIQWGPWSTASPLSNINGGNSEDPSMTADGLHLYFSSDRLGTGYRVYRATREAVGQPFGAAVLVPEFNTEGISFGAISGDGLEFYFNRVNGTNDDIYVMTRTAVNGTFANPELVASLSTGAVDFNPELSSNGLFATVTQIVGGSDRALVLYSRPSVSATWSPAGGLANLQTAFWESAGSISSDGLTIVFHSDRDTNGGASDLYIATRASTAESFSAALPLTEFNTMVGHETDPSLSADQRTLLWADAQRRIVSATRQPL